MLIRVDECFEVFLVSIAQATKLLCAVYRSMDFIGLIWSTVVSDHRGTNCESWFELLLIIFEVNHGHDVQIYAIA